MSKQYIHIKPLDTLFFRGGKPFEMTEESWVEPSLLMPYPTVFWGALFTTLLYEKKVTLNDKESLKIKSTYLYNHIDKKILTPAPLDLFYEEDNDSFFPEKYEDISISSHKLNSFAVPDINKKVESSENLFININDLASSYYARNPNRTTVFYPQEFALNSPKIGIARNKTTRTVAESHLYKIEMIELAENWGYLVECETEHEFSDGILKLGGEGKLASYTKIEKPKFLEEVFNNLQTLGKSDYHKIYIQSPTFWESGDALNELQNLNLLSASIGKCQAVGGFDFVSKSPKKMLKAIPSGSVYLFKNSNLEELRTAFLSYIQSNSLNTNGFGNFQIIPFKKRKNL
jgi:CRISPR-associated protein Cmr3